MTGARPKPPAAQARRPVVPGEHYAPDVIMAIFDRLPARPGQRPTYGGVSRSPGGAGTGTDPARGAAPLDRVRSLRLWLAITRSEVPTLAGRTARPSAVTSRPRRVPGWPATGARAAHRRAVGGGDRRGAPGPPGWCRGAPRGAGGVSGIDRGLVETRPDTAQGARAAGPAAGLLRAGSGCPIASCTATPSPGDPDRRGGRCGSFQLGIGRVGGRRGLRIVGVHMLRLDQGVGWAVQRPDARVEHRQQRHGQQRARDPPDV